jgi:hypothetical protein
MFYTNYFTEQIYSSLLQKMNQITERSGKFAERWEKVFNRFFGIWFYCRLLNRSNS